MLLPPGLELKFGEATWQQQARPRPGSAGCRTVQVHRCTGSQSSQEAASLKCMLLLSTRASCPTRACAELRAQQPMPWSKSLRAFSAAPSTVAQQRSSAGPRAPPLPGPDHRAACREAPTG